MLCECGCGEKTRLARQTDHAKGWVKDQPLRYVLGHNARGKKFPPRPVNSTDYHTIHQWLNRHFQKSGACEDCGRADRRTVWAFLRHPSSYTRNPEDYRELCTGCHMRLDRGEDWFYRFSKQGHKRRWGEAAAIGDREAMRAIGIQ